MKLLARHSGLFPDRSVRSVWLAAVVLLALGVCALAQDQNQPQSQLAIRVARISLIEGEVSYQRGGSNNDKNTDWFDATVNLPLDEKDQVYSGRNGRAEIQFNGRTLARVDRDTNLRITQFNTSAIQLAQAIGTATFRVDNLDRRQFHVYDVKSGSIDDPLHFEVDTPAVAVTFLKEGNYRINVRDDGTTEVIVRKGLAEVYNQEIGAVTVKSGRRIIIEGQDSGDYQIAKLDDKDNWDRWNDRRDDDLFARLDTYRSSQYVPASVAGLDDLDRHGDWINTPEYGWVWSPRGVAAGWAPYRAGYWRWHGSWGWTWISYEPWGWAPYHYGRWTYWRSRWCWTPYINVGISFWNWSPHLVAFFGWGGGGYGRGYRDGYWDGYRDGRGWLGWCPLGWGERWGGGYYGRSRTIINNTVIVNNTIHVRSLDSLRNYNAPNGASGLEGRRFNEARVLADNISAPPRGAGRLVAADNVDGTPGSPLNNSGAERGAGRGVETLAGDVLRPTQNEVARALPVERNSSVARALEAPMVARHLPTGEGRAMPARGGSESNLDNNGPARSGREGQGMPERNLPSRESNLPSRDSGLPSRNTSSGALPEGAARPERRAPDYQPVERVERPTVTRPSSEDRSMPRRDISETGSTSGAPRERSAPRNDGDMPRRAEIPTRAPERTEAPRSVERPERGARPNAERREMPQRPPERTDAPRPPERYDPPRENRMPSRGPDRPSLPERSAPSRESAPARTERPSGGPERSLPTRKPDS